MGVVGLIAPISLMAAGGAAQASGSGDSTFKVAPDTVTRESTVHGDKAPTSRLAQSDPALLSRTDSQRVPVMIKLDYDSTATYTGGVKGLAATSPSVTGAPLTGKSSKEKAYEGYLADQEQSIEARIKKAVPSATFSGSLRRVYGGVTATVPADSAKVVANVPGVVAVQRNTMNKPLTDASPEFLDAGPAYQALGGAKNAGKGLIYGNLDTGLWPEHPSFADQGNLAAPPGPARECNFGDNPLTPANDPFVCQHKLIGGAWETQDYDANPSNAPDPYAGTARDGEGHGTHTASTTAGDVVQHAPLLGVDRGPLHGMAPGAWVMEYKVCGPDGCVSSDSVRAVQQAIVDGVNVINYSISGGTSPFTDPVELAFLDAYAAGVFVSASAGNDGPAAGTANHLSPWVTSVAASTQKREFDSDLSLTAGNGDTFHATGASVTAGAGPAPVVLAQNVPGYTDPLCGAEPPASNTFAGMIIACQRGTQARAWKSFVAHEGGAAGLILYNPTLADVETDNHWLPTVHLADGTAFVAFMNGHTNVTGSFTAGQKRQGPGDVMAAFSSRGPAGLFIKPDVTAPGVEILAGNTPTPAEPNTENGAGPPGELYQAIAGTSMSSPHVAGAGLLLKAVHPTWTPGQIRSALMTTAITSVVKEDETTPADPFDMGAGRIDIGKAMAAPLTLDESVADFAALGNDPLHAADLNIPSIDAPVMPGALRTTRTLTNVSGQAQTVATSSSAPAKSTITVSPAQVTLRPGQSRTFTITVRSKAPKGQQQFGAVMFTAGSTKLHLPVAFIHTQGSVSLTQSCTPTTVTLAIPGHDTTECSVQAVNNSFDDQAVDLTSTTPDNFWVTGVTSGPATVGSSYQTVHASGTLAGASPGVPSVAVGHGPGDGYLPLSAFGITPTPIGDEDVVNFNVPSFTYDGESWNKLGVDSNGYLIVGGGSSEDNECCSLPSGASPNPPNNILAPFWTDLNGTGADGFRIATLSDGADTWIVVDWAVNVFGTTDTRHFETWIGVNGDAHPGQDISYEYSANQASPGQPFLVGAENELGEGQMSATLPTTAGRVVTSTDAVPGDVIAYSFTAQAIYFGSGDMVTRMTASGVPGTTIERTRLKVKLPQ
jgi:hypothetical protein